MKRAPIILNKAKKSASISLYDTIGEDYWTGGGISAKQFSEDLKALGEVDEIEVNINSPGGSVWAGLSIYNQLVAHKAKVIVNIDGMAASAASFIAMAGDEIRASEASMMMVHRAQGMEIGSADDMAKMASILETHDRTIAGIYAKRTGHSEKEWMALMSAETWMTGAEAKDQRLVDTLTPAKSVENRFDLEAMGYRNVPQALKLAVTTTDAGAAKPVASTELPITAAPGGVVEFEWSEPLYTPSGKRYTPAAALVRLRQHEVEE